MRRADRPGIIGWYVGAFLACAAVHLCIHVSAAQVRQSLALVTVEADGIVRFTQSLTDYYAQFQGLKKAIKPSDVLINAVETRAQSVRSSIPGCVQNLNGFVSKLKAAGKWTKDLDIHVEQVAANNGLNPAFVNEVKQAGGARATLEKGVTEISQLAAEIDQDLIQIRSMKEKSASSNPNLLREARALPIAYSCANMRTLATMCVLTEQIACARSTIISYMGCAQK
jgi:hypothetical protein